MATTPAEAASSGTDQEWREPGLITGTLSERHVPGTGSPMRWFFSAVWLVYLISPVADLFGHGHGVAWIAGGLAITVAFCVIYMLVLMYSDEQPRLGRYGLVAIAVLAGLACAVYGKEWTPLWIYVSAATGLVLAAAPDGPRVAAIEVITAQSALEAAGIGLDDDAELTLRSGTFDPDAEAVLGWCLREAVTNVIRHSRAGHCRIRLAGHGGELSLEVTDDGHGFADHDPDHPRGSGLRGMSERLSTVGGRLSLGPAEPGHTGGHTGGHSGSHDRGFRLVATVPAALAATGHNCQL